MRILSLSVMLVCSMAVLPVVAQQTADDVLDSIEQAVRDSDVDALMALAGKRLDVSVLGEGKNYSRSQADFVLDQFFARHHATSFRFTASSKTEKGRFVEGLYFSSENRKPLQVYVRLQKSGGKWELREFLVKQPRR